MLEQGFEGMVINILIYIEGLEYIERMAEVNFSWDRGVTSKDREQVHSTDYGIDVDN